MDDPATATLIAKLKAGVHYRHGTCRPYRPAPVDFRETFIRVGWEREIQDIYHANSACILRWIDECGGDELREARSRISGVPHSPSRRALLPTYADAVAAVVAGADLDSLARLSRRASQQSSGRSAPGTMAQPDLRRDGPNPDAARTRSPTADTHPAT